MLDKIKSYLWTFVAGVGASVIAWLALSSRGKRRTKPPSELEAELSAAKAVTNGILPKQPPTDKEARDAELRKRGFLK